MENQLVKERRRVREVSRIDPAVQRALTAFEDAREATLRKGKRQRDVEAQRRAEVSRLGNDVKKARKVLKAQQAKLLDAEEAIDIKQAVQRRAYPSWGRASATADAQQVEWPGSTRCFACLGWALACLQLSGQT